MSLIDTVLPTLTSSQQPSHGSWLERILFTHFVSS